MFETNFSFTTTFGGYKNMGEHCPRMPVATGL